MFSRSAALLSFAATALALSAGDLTVKLSAVSSTVSSLDDIILTAVLSNPTSEDVKIVKFGSVLDDSELSTQAFTVSKGDVELTFTGLSVYADLSDEKAYITIPAGGSRAVNHTVAASYDFETAGTGTFTFETYSHLSVTEAGEILPFEIEPVSVDVEVTHDVAKRHVFGEAPTLEKRLSNAVCDNVSRRNYLYRARDEARAVAGTGAAFVRSHPNSNEYSLYFGNANRDSIWRNFDMIAGDLPSAGVRGLHCIDRPNGACRNGGVIAYVLLVTSGDRIVSSEAYFCESFFQKSSIQALCNGVDFYGSYAHIMLHELTHGVNKSRDHVYGCPGARALSNALKWENADNYPCYALHRWKSVNC